ncbi:hypothetical protein [Rhodococcus koreensis]|uniref:hypothetical protein n=1 Tax=Rhodococcus koreensis TaxID=99653 RepID=UPI0009353E44|nr:hypothetical protein [Rhodococcus koreensis]
MTADGISSNRAYWILRDGNIDVSAYTRQSRDQPSERIVLEYVGTYAQEGALGQLTPAFTRQLAAVLNAAADAAETSKIPTASTDPGKSPMTSASVQVGQVRADNNPRVNAR